MTLNIWLEGGAAVAAAIVVYLTTLGPAGVIAAMGFAVLNTIAGNASVEHYMLPIKCYKFLMCRSNIVIFGHLGQVQVTIMVHITLNLCPEPG